MTDYDRGYIVGYDIGYEAGYNKVVPYVGLRTGKVRTEFVTSEYYCGGCGYPVTDHDSFCSECGCRLHPGRND